jgi:hypothetical protein
MENFNARDLNSKLYRSVIVQKGGALEMDRYIYNMGGEGLGNYFGSLLKQAIPLLGSAAIKGSRALKPIVTAAGKDIIAAGIKRGAKEVTKHIVHKPHKKRRRAKKWQSL